MTLDHADADADGVRARLLPDFSKVFLIVSPPRCGSTAFARVFWEQPSVGYYCHEPFEACYYEHLGISHAYAKLENPLALKEFLSDGRTEHGRELLVKEMSFQVGSSFPVLARLTEEPVFFLIRDPRLSIASKMAKKVEGGYNPVYPPKESGWQSLLSQVEYCQKNDIHHALVDSTDFRDHPEAIFRQVFAMCRLPFHKHMLSWKSCRDLNLDNLDGRHCHWYSRVLASTSIQPANEPMPSLDSFPLEGGFRDHVLECVEIYRLLSALPERVARDG